MPSRSWIAHLFTIFITACGSASDDDGHEANVEPLPATALEACHRDCEHSDAAGCTNMPPNWLESCKLLCQGTEEDIPSECTDEYFAFRLCAATKGSYACSDKGVAKLVTPGICANEGAACLSCSTSCLLL